MSTPFALLLRLSGMSQREAARFLDLSPSSVDKFSRGATEPKPGVLRELRDLIGLQVATAADAIDAIEDAAESSESPPREIVLGYPADDHEAQSLGFPNTGAWWGMAAHVVADLDVPIRFVPRGSDAGTAAAIDAIERGQKDVKKS